MRQVPGCAYAGCTNVGHTLGPGGLLYCNEHKNESQATGTSQPFVARQRSDISVGGDPISPVSFGPCCCCCRRADDEHVPTREEWLTFLSRAACWDTGVSALYSVWVILVLLKRDVAADIKLVNGACVALYWCRAAVGWVLYHKMLERTCSVMMLRRLCSFVLSLVVLTGLALICSCLSLGEPFIDEVAVSATMAPPILVIFLLDCVHWNALRQFVPWLRENQWPDAEAATTTVDLV